MDSLELEAVNGILTSASSVAVCASFEVFITLVYGSSATMVPIH